ncbi:hypothetical protein NPN16_23910, partial [Vibrio parahaemolyticus]|uniref:hypothetical protein n=1 Tax=Vibrio parahaemolyticus TaxID=670 RepID=UPI0021137786
MDGTGILTITDTQRHPSAPSRLHSLPVRPGVRITGGDSQFKAALDAQVAQMLMGTVGEETRPGDPMNYPL